MNVDAIKTSFHFSQYTKIILHAKIFHVRYYKSENINKCNNCKFYACEKPMIYSARRPDLLSSISHVSYVRVSMRVSLFLSVTIKIHSPPCVTRRARAIKCTIRVSAWGRN